MTAPTSPRHSVSVAAAIIDGAGRMLTVRRADNGHWELPGGALELDEPIEVGLRREVLEETGLDVRPDVLTGVYKNMRQGIVALVFRCALTGSTQVPHDEEITELRWMTPDEIRDHLDEAYAARLLDALDNGPPRIRAHDGIKVLQPDERVG